MIHGLHDLETQGFEVIPSEAPTEKAQKRFSLCAEMEHAARHGVPQGDMSEGDIWAVLHAENIRRGGE